MASDTADPSPHERRRGRDAATRAERHRRGDGLLTDVHGEHGRVDRDGDVGDLPLDHDVEEEVGPVLDEAAHAEPEVWPGEEPRVLGREAKWDTDAAERCGYGREPWGEPAARTEVQRPLTEDDG